MKIKRAWRVVDCQALWMEKTRPVWLLERKPQTGPGILPFLVIRVEGCGHE
ncbi:MAG: hypothetical protein WBC70_07410 [Candidatus Aminicenantales bacterium]